jgi:ubiquinone/menaquinone biosynthesis C-methylase UbiE
MAMAKQGEIDYLKNIGAAGIHHAVNKPFSDPACGDFLMELGAIMTLLPAPPAKLLDLGCGTGWTSCFWAKRGYQVIGQDIAPDMIDYAQRNKAREGLDNLDFIVCDYEAMALDDRFNNWFDCAVFFDCLHHSLDEVQALKQVYRSLKPGGLCITSEPGKGHAADPGAIAAVQQFNVTERDMPPSTVIRAGKAVGFRQARVYPHASNLNVIYRQPSNVFLQKLFRLPLMQSLALAYLNSWRKRANGIVVLVK